MDYKKVSDLKNWEQNPRSIHEKDFERLKKQIQTLGQYKPLLVTKDGTVLGGNMRLRAYRELGIKDVWVSIVEASTEDKKLEYALSDNDRAGFYDTDLLANLIPNYPDFTWEDYAVDLKQPQNLGDLIDSFKEVEEDEIPEVSNEPAVSQLGEVYQLGRHRLMCGDATKIEDVERLMNGQKADMVFTDPPYNINYQDLQGSHEKIQNDKMEDEEFIQFLKDSFSLFNSPRGYICCNWKCYPLFFKAMAESGLYPKSCIVWDRKHGTQNLDKYFKQHEFVIYFGEFGGEKTLGGDVWEISREIRDDRPTAKPVELCARAIRDSSIDSGLVLDVFGGSGSTLIACEQTNRICYMMELAPRYCDVILKRYENFIGKQ